MNRPPDDPSDSSPAPDMSRVGGEPPDTAIEPLPPRRSVGRNIVALLVSQSFTWVLATIIVSIAPRFLGPTSLGQLRIGTSVWMMAVVLAGLGTATLLIVEVARNPRIAKSLIHHVIGLRLTMLVPLIPAIAILAVAASYDSTTILIIALGGVAAAFTLASSSYSAGLHGLQEMGATARVDVLTKLLLTVATIVILLAGGRAVALSVLGIAMSVLGFVMLRRATKPRLPAGQVPARSRGRALALAGVPFLFAEAGLVIYQQIDTIVMSLLVDRDAIGWYATADALFGSLLFIPVILTTSLFPAMAERYARDPFEVQVMLNRMVRSLLLVAVPIGLATFIVSRSFVSVLYGPRYEESGPVLEVFGIVVILSSLTIVLGRYAMATERVRFWSVLMFAAIVISIPMDIVLVDWTDRRFDNGALGGALAYVVTEGLMLIVGVVRLAPRLMNRAMVGRLARLAVAGGAMMAVGWPLRSRFFLVSGGASLVTYAVVLLVLSTFDDDERQYAARASRGVRRVLGRAT